MEKTLLDHDAVRAPPRRADSPHMGCLECVLKSLNFVDLTVAAAVCAGTAYSIWHLHNESPSWVYGPILAADALFAFSTLLSWFTLSCHLAACAWLINISIVIDLLVAVGAAIFGALLLTQFATVQECAFDRSSSFAVVDASRSAALTLRGAAAHVQRRAQGSGARPVRVDQRLPDSARAVRPPDEMEDDDRSRVLRARRPAALPRDRVLHHQGEAPAVRPSIFLLLALVPLALALLVVVPFLLLPLPLPLPLLRLPQARSLTMLTRTPA